MKKQKNWKSLNLYRKRGKNMYVCHLVQFCTFCIQTVFVVFILFFVHIAYSYLLVWILLRLKMLFIYRRHKWLCCTRRSFHVAPILNSLKFSNLASSTMNASCLNDTTTDTNLLHVASHLHVTVVLSLFLYFSFGSLHSPCLLISQFSKLCLETCVMLSWGTWREVGHVN